MRASYNWLKEFVDFKLPPKELAHLLTMAGLEVEATEEKESDTVFDIGITPNRPDCLSIRGIAREISAILSIPLKDVSTEIKDQKGEGPSVEIEKDNLCLRYASRIIQGVNPGPSPEWLSERLETHGIRPTSNIVDVTNYVLLEFGQPLHAFDLDKLSSRKIVVKQTDGIDKFVTLDGEERNLNKNTLLIWDAEQPVAIAGVMGGYNTEVTESTRNILLESAYFAPASVRRTSKSLNLSTESSYRFERGVDINAITPALDRSAQLIKKLAGGQISRISDVYPNPYAPKRICITFDRINSLIGTDIDGSLVRGILKNLGFSMEDEDERIFVTPPGFRNDVKRDVDIVEEIARLYGYDKIPSTLPTIQLSAVPEHRTQRSVKSIKDSMTKSGFMEVINYSFLNPDVLDKLNLSRDDIRRKVVFIRNPLRKEEEAMRTTLVPALLNNISLNLNRGEKTLSFFEIARVFLPSEEKLPDEIIHLGAVFHKESGIRNSIWEDKHDGFYDVKGVLENLFQELRIGDYSFNHDPSSTEPYLHPGKSCSVIVNGNRTGSLGSLHPRVSESFGIRGNITLLEVYDLEKLLTTAKEKVKFSPLPRYPYVERDMALVVSDDVTVSAVKNEIFEVDSDIIESVNLFDIYKGKPIPRHKKSLAFSIRYRSSEKTLTDSEVDELHLKILSRLQSKVGAELRS